MAKIGQKWPFFDFIAKYMHGRLAKTWFLLKQKVSINFFRSFHVPVTRGFCIISIISRKFCKNCQKTWFFNRDYLGNRYSYGKSDWIFEICRKFSCWIDAARFSLSRLLHHENWGQSWAKLGQKRLKKLGFSNLAKNFGIKFSIFCRNMLA